MFGSNLKQARARNAELLAGIAREKSARNLIGDRIIGESRTLTADERAAFVAGGRRIDGLEADLAAHKPVLDAAEQQNEAERSWRAGDVDPDLAAGHAAMRAAGIHVPARGHDGGTSALGRPTGPTWAAMFGAPRGASPWAGRGAEFLTTVASGRSHPDLQMQASVMSSEDGPSGLIVPDELAREWFDSTLSGVEPELVRPRATVWPMASRTRTVPSWDIADMTGGAVGGLTIAWIGEGGASVPQAAKPRLIKLMSRKGAIFAEATSELAADGMDFNAQLEQVMRRAISYGLDRSFLRGDGANCPLGIFESSARVTVPRSKAGHIVFDDLTAMFSRLLPASMTNAVWVAHPSTIPDLSSLSIAVGTGGSVVPVMTSGNGTFTILTRPVVFSSKVPSLGTAGDIGLFDFSRYIIGVRREVSIEMSNAPGWLTDSQSFRLIIRVDGQPADATPFQPEGGAPTMSAFVTLDDAE
jgi:HK97 family phage major capsid protein